MTNDELAALRAAAEAATPGPWEWAKGYEGLYGTGPKNDVLSHADHEGMWLGVHNDEANAAYISAVNPVALLRLLAHVEALTSRVAERDALLRECSDWLATSGNDREIEVSAKVDALLGPEKPAQVAPGG